MPEPDYTAIARAKGYKLGRSNVHHTADNFYTSAEWRAWLEGHRAGYAEYRAEFEAMLRGMFPVVPPITKRPPTSQERRNAYLERKSA